MHNSQYFNDQIIYFSSKVNDKMKKIIKGSSVYIVFLIGAVVTFLFFFAGNKIEIYTSSDSYCMSCHVHTSADMSWKQSVHHYNPSGVVIHCVDCHLPPKGEGYWPAKIKHGAKDIYGKHFKDPTELDWEDKSKIENAVIFTYEESCIKCHQNLFSKDLSKDGEDAHLHYQQEQDKMHCINCHIDVGHYDENRKHAKNIGFALTPSEKNLKKYKEAAKVNKFENFTEQVPETSVSFEMIAVKGGEFEMGSPDEKNDPLNKVQIKNFWIGKTEVSWNEFLAFFRATESEGRKEAENSLVNLKVDAISGPTPPWGAPDQGWGKDKRPAITMSHHAAEVYCKWLSQITGKKYRLPTEAEWEYACRGGTKGDYFFNGEPDDFGKKGFIGSFFGNENTLIDSFVIYVNNSHNKTLEPIAVKGNPLGIKHMLGNVSEFCSDISDDGTEHIIRGGSFNDKAKDVRCASKEYTKTTQWMVTDPQMPKSIWWYSDCNHVGFRVVCETEQGEQK